MVLAAVIDYRRLREWALFFFAVTTALLLAVTVLARAHNGAKAWFAFGPFQLQPSELAKVTLILVLASLRGQRSRARSCPSTASSAPSDSWSCPS